MATFTWLFYSNTPAWHDISSNTVVFSGSGGISTPITVGNWQDETHLGSGDPGTDQCGTTHGNNVQYITGTKPGKTKQTILKQTALSFLSAG